MRLSQVVIPTINVQFGPEPEQFFPVRGLNINDLLTLVADHAPDALALYDRFNEARMELNGEPFTVAIALQLFTQALKEAPALIFNGIAIAAQDPDAAEKASQLPLSVQVDTLQAIFAASIRTEAEVKKLGEFALNLLKMVMIVKSKINTPSPAGSGVSESA